MKANKLKKERLYLELTETQKRFMDADADEVLFGGADLCAEISQKPSAYFKKDLSRA